MGKDYDGEIISLVSEPVISKGVPIKGKRIFMTVHRARVIL
jgi:hypothetical protein